MIETLDHRSAHVAEDIHRVFQDSYPVEAALIGVVDFPPLRRSPADIRAAVGGFLGCRPDTELAALVEYVFAERHLSIDSLVVRPAYFRRGLASSLLRTLLDQFDWQTAVVETAAKNGPAISLYEKYGFAIVARWTTEHEIDKVRLELSRETIEQGPALATVFGTLS